MIWILYALIILIALNILVFVILSAILYSVLLVRTKPEKWGHEVSLPEDPEYVRMYHAGLEWGEKHADSLREVWIENDGLKLFGHYFDFGFDRAVIIIPGRMECCRYSYYFGESYRAAGYNVLTVDVRAHGRSDGKICSLGHKEYRDILAWGKMLHDDKGIGEIVLHGICVGASTALFTLISDQCPEYFKAMVSDGMYVSFGETFKNHMLEKNRPLFPFYPLVMAYVRIFSGVNAVGDGPLRRIGQLKKPILFIHSRKDIYSLPEKTELLFAACGSEQKQLVWFDKGGHSRIRFNSTEEYDKTVRDFLSSLGPVD